MRGLFGFGSKLANKLTATRFVYSFTVHNLSPWPHAQRAIAVGWQRGKKKRGATKSVYPSTAPGRIGSVVRFNEKFEVSASLYKAATGSSVSSTLGPFKKKCIILAVLETDGRTQATAALGRVVIDLAEFAAIEQQETRTFQVTCNKSIHAAIGDPQLIVTIRCRWKNSSATVGNSGDAAVDDIGSISTDTTGSRMTANLSSFLRFKYNNKGQANEEQDLQGFDASAVSAKQLRDKQMGTIQEGPDEEAHGARRPQPLGGLSPTGSGGGMFIGGTSSDNGRVATVSAASAAAGAAVGAAAGSSLREMYGRPGGVSRSPRSSRQGDEALTPARSGSDLGSTAGPSLSDLGTAGPSTFTELLTVAATEVCVYLARVSAQGRKPQRNVHAAARRVARTMVCLGQQQGTAFGRQVVQLVESQIASLGEDLGGLAFWWSNVVHLRGLLQALGSPEYAVGSLPSVRWAADALVPDLIRLERTVLFERVLQQLWGSLVAHALPLKAGAAPPGAAKAVPSTKRAMQEAAIKHWFGGLDSLAQRLEGLGSRGHTKLLRQQVLQQCLKRLDALLFHHLLTGPDDADDAARTAGILEDYDPGSTLWGSLGAPVPTLDEAYLPFTRGLLTFGSGMGVKMTVTRLQQWASGEGLSEVGAMGTPALQFPLLRTTADLLMMPKELLLEQAIRRDVSQSLSVRSMVHILEKFQPDEYAHDSISPEVVATLQEEQAVAPSTRPPLSDLSLGYRAPSEDVILQKGDDSAREPGLEYEVESEGELEELGLLVGGGQGVPSRIRMLHQLWALGVPRRRPL